MCSNFFLTFQNIIGEWNFQGLSPNKLAASSNNILGHILNRMFSLVAPTPVSDDTDVELLCIHALFCLLAMLEAFCPILLRERCYNKNDMKLILVIVS